MKVIKKLKEQEQVLIKGRFLAQKIFQIYPNKQINIKYSLLVYNLTQLIQTQ